MDPAFFASPAALRRWFERHHADKNELIIGFYKKVSGRPSVTYSEALDEALCVGWIDGVRRSLGVDSYTIRFTPRKPVSYWSAVNRRRATALEAAGRMQPAGQAAFERSARVPPRKYSFENKPKRLTPALEKRFRANAQRVGVLPGAAAGLSPDGHVLRDECCQGRDEGEAADQTHRGFRCAAPAGHAGTSLEGVTPILIVYAYTRANAARASATPSSQVTPTYAAPYGPKMMIARTMG